MTEDQNHKQDSIELDDELGALIGTALGDLNPSPVEFEQAVLRRLGREPAQGDASCLRMKHEESTASSGPVPQVLRRAAAFLPPFLLPQAASKGIGIGLGTLTKKSGWSYFSTLAAFPALVLVMLGATFFIALRKAVPARGQALSSREAKIEVRLWWRRNFLGVLVACLALMYLGTIVPVDAMMMFFAVSMLALVGIFSSLAAAGLATRAEIARRCSACLYSLMWFGIMFIDTAPLLAEGQQLALGVPFNLTLGAILCAALGVNWRQAEERKRGLLAILGGLVVAAILASTQFLPRNQSADRVDALTYIQSGFNEANDARYAWEEVPRIYAHLAADAGSLPSLAAFETSLRAAQKHHSAQSPNAPNEHTWRWLAAQGHVALPSLTGGSFERERSRLFDQAEPYDRRLAQALATAALGQQQGLSEVQIQRAEARLIALMPEPDAYECVEDMLLLSWVLRGFGGAQYDARLSARVREVLLATWDATPNAFSAGFASSASRMERDQDGLLIERRRGYGDLEASAAAVHLLGIYGLPSEIDIEALGNFLESKTRTHGFSVEGPEALAAAALSHLHALPEWEMVLERRKSEGWFKRLLGIRLYLGSLALSLLFILVTLRAPRSIRPA